MGSISPDRGGDLQTPRFSRDLSGINGRMSCYLIGFPENSVCRTRQPSRRFKGLGPFREKYRNAYAITWFYWSRHASETLRRSLFSPKRGPRVSSLVTYLGAFARGTV